jgi:small-conductance mechanosensitive channel
MSKVTNSEQRNDKDFLVEYQKAQDSAQHQDTLIWTATGVAWAGNVALLAFAFSKITKPYFQPFVVLLAFLGISAVVTAAILTVQLIDVKNQKYERCKQLESCYGFKQHQDLKYRAGPQKIAYTVTALLFIMVWLFILWAIWSGFFPVE